MNDVEECLAQLDVQREAVAKTRSLKLDSVPLDVHHFVVLGRILGKSEVAAEVVQTEDAEDDAEGGIEINLFDFDGEAPESAVTMISDPQVVSTSSAPDELSEQELIQSLTIMRSSGPSSDAWSPLWQALPRSLRHLDLSENSLNDHAVAALCGALRFRAIHLVSLNLHGNRCKDVQRLADLVSRGQVEMLDLSENTLNDRVQQFSVGRVSRYGGVVCRKLGVLLAKSYNKRHFFNTVLQIRPKALLQPCPS